MTVVRTVDNVHCTLCMSVHIYMNIHEGLRHIKKANDRYKYTAKYNKIVKIYKYINKNRTNNKVTEETSQQKQTEYNYKT